jgi:CBS domain-containing protein
VAIRHTLTGVRALDVMTHEIPTVTRDMSLEEYVHEVLRTGVLTHIVVGAEKPVGLVSLQAARTVPRDEWTTNSVQAVMLPVDRIQLATPDEPVLAVLERMQKEDIAQMPVASDGHIVGMISRDAILRVLQTRLQIGHLAHH